MAPLPEPRWAPAAALGSDGRIYAWAGYVDPPEAKGVRTWGRGRYAMVAYDPEEDRWERVQEPARSQEFALTLGTGPRYRHRSRLYGDWLDFHVPTGSANASGEPAWLNRDGWVIGFDPETGSWSDLRAGRKVPPYFRRLPATARVFQRKGAAVATDVEGRVYVMGGDGRILGSENRYALQASVEVFDPRTGRWTSRTRMRRARQHFAAAFGPDGKLYVFGGFGGVGVMRIDDSDPEMDRKLRENRELAASALRSVEVYDPATNRWEPRSNMPEGRDFTGAALGADGRIYVVGGSSIYGSRAQRSVLVYDPARDTWTYAPPLRRARYGHAVVATPDGAIYALGGLGYRGREDGLLHRLFDRERGPLASVERLETRPREGPLRHDASGFREDPRHEIPALVEALDDSDPLERRRAATELARRVLPGDTELVPRLTQLLGEDDAETRRQGALALRWIGPGAGGARPALVAKLADPDPAVRWAVAETLLDLGPPLEPVAPVLLAFLASEDRIDRVRAVEALVRMGPAVIPDLAAELARPDHPDPLAPIRALAELGAVAELAEALTDARAEVREAAAYELGELGERAEPAIPALLRAMEQPYGRPRTRATMALGRIGAAALPELLEALAEAAPGERTDLVWAVAEAGGGSPPVLAALRRYLEASQALPDPAPRSTGTRAACEQLGRLEQSLPGPCEKWWPPRPPRPSDTAAPVSISPD